jgi:hypothetical protein
MRSLDEISLKPRKWWEHQEYVDYSKAIEAILTKNGAMDSNTGKMTDQFSANEQANMATGLFNNLPTSTEMERSFKDVISELKKRRQE